jgi:hypothetical protein
MKQEDLFAPNANQIGENCSIEKKKGLFAFNQFTIGRKRKRGI